MNKALLATLGTLVISTLNQPQTSLYIPRFDQDITVYTAPERGRTWDLSQIGNQTARLVLAQQTNIVIAGHKEDAFGYLKRLESGDFVYYTENGTTDMYQVIDIKVIDDNDLSILETDGTQQLTMFTCMEEGYPYTRYVVIAEYRGQVFCSTNGEYPTEDCE